MRERMRSLVARAREATDELGTLAVAITDDRTPWYAKAVMGLTLGLAASPIDPIPDFVPVLGYLDDLVFVPVGVWLAWRTTPEAVLVAARERDDRLYEGRARWVVGAVILLLWVLGGLAAGWLAWRLLG